MSAEADVAPAAIRYADLIRPGDRIAVGQGVSEPLSLVAALRDQAADLDAEVFVGFSLSGLFDVDFARRMPVSSYGAMGSLAAVAREGLLRVFPVNYSDLPALIRDDLRVDAVLLQVSPPDADGMCSTGLAMDAAVESLSGARVVIAEINDQLPVHRDAVRIPADRITASVQVSRPLLELPDPEPSAIDEAIAAGVASVVPDGATVQLGFGATVNAIGRLLTERRGLRVHSALAGTWLLELARSGALADPEPNRPVVMIGAVMGTGELYEFVVNDPRVRMGRIEEIQSPGALAQVERLHAVNGALQVDLAGQVNVEMLGDHRVSALGGHTDFLRGAQASAGGRSIVALPATAGRRKLPRIVERLDSGWVSSQQSVVDTVVTEHGVADLRGLDLSQRRQALVGLADPEHRPNYLPEPIPEMTS